MKLGFGLGTKKRMSLADIEREAAAEIQMRVDAGKPPREEWAALEDRAALDTDVSHLGQWSATPQPTLEDTSAVAQAEAPEAAVEPAAASTKPATRKPATRKPVARKPVTRQATVRKPAARKPAASKSAVGGE